MGHRMGSGDTGLGRGFFLIICILGRKRKEKKKKERKASLRLEIIYLIEKEFGFVWVVIKYFFPPKISWF